MDLILRSADVTPLIAGAIAYDKGNGISLTKQQGLAGVLYRSDAGCGTTWLHGEIRHMRLWQMGGKGSQGPDGTHMAIQSLPLYSPPIDAQHPSPSLSHFP